MSAVIQRVAVTSDTASMVKAMRATFSGSTTWIGEVLQNARRAGSPDVRFSLMGVDDDLTVVIDDTGCGVEDFNTLLSMCKSGWSEAIQASETPYGVGAFSYFYSCDHVTITTNGKRLSASTDDLLLLKPIDVTASDSDATGTRITLTGVKLRRDRVLKALADLVVGFPIPVFIDGVELARPCALSPLFFDDSYVASPIGWVQRSVINPNIAPRYFLHGLPINKSVGHFGDRYSTSLPCVHLDSSLFFGRMPDREVLLNPEESFLAIDAAINDVRRDLLRELSKSMPLVEFLVGHAEACVKLGLTMEVLEPLGAIPRSWLSCWDKENSPGLNEHDTWEMHRSSNDSKIIRREHIEGEVVYHLAQESSENCLAQVFICSMDRFWTHEHYVIGQLPDDFWLKKQIVTVDGYGNNDDGADFTIETVGETKTAKMSSSWIDADVIVADTVRLVHPTLGVAVVKAPLGVYDNGTFYVTADTGGDVVKQASNYDGENDDFVESAYDSALDGFARAVKYAINPDHSDLLASYLNDNLGAWKRPSVLNGRSFTIRFVDGKPVVVEELPQEQA